MTTSTDSTKPFDKSKQKKIKSPGPIRFEAIVPITIIIVIMALYGKFFFDANLASGLEYTGSVIHGAEVNIDEIETSLFGASFNLKGLQVTDKSDPMFNLIQIDEIRLKLLWDALLRAKFVVDDAFVHGISFKVPRKKAGEILKSDGKGSEALKNLEQGVLEQSKEDFQGNVLGDLATILGGADAGEQLKSIKEELLVEKKIDEISADLDAKEESWKKSIESLTQKEDLERIQKKIKNLKVDKKKPWVALKEINQLAKEIKAKTSEFQKVSSEIKSMYEKYGNTIKNIDKLAEQDIKSLQDRFQLPNLDATDFSMGLFGRMFQDKVASIRKYAVLAKKYMPDSVTKKVEGITSPGSKDETPAEADPTQAELVPTKRGDGRNVQFPITTGYPLFWLKKADVSSKTGKSEFSGDVEGSVTNFTSDPKIVKKPANINLAGDFPKQKIFGFMADVDFIHHIDQPMQKIKVNVEKFPIGGMNLSNSENLQFGIDKATAKSQLNATIRGELAEVSLNNAFSGVDYQIDTESSKVREILTKVVEGIPSVTVNASAKGPFDKLKWRINSNLGKELASGVKRELKGKVDEAKNQYKKLVEDKIGPKKRELTAKYDQIKSRLDKLLGEKKSKVEEAKNQALGEVKGKEKSGVESDVKSKAKKLLKKFKF